MPILPIYYYFTILFCIDFVDKIVHLFKTFCNYWSDIFLFLDALCYCFLEELTVSDIETLQIVENIWQKLVVILILAVISLN